MAAATSPSEYKGCQVGKSLSQCLLDMFENQVDCDITFQIKGRDEYVHSVHAHKFMIKARIPEFEDVYRNIDSNKIDICDIDIEPFKEMMRYIYSDTFTGENVMHILYAAKKYKIQGLQMLCEEFIAKMSVESVCGIFSAALFYDIGDLVSRCLKFIAGNTKDVLKSDGFCKMSYDALLKLLEADCIPHGVEDEVYNACVEWAKHQIGENHTDEKIRATLGRCLYQIRFHQIPHEQFVNVVCKSHILNSDERSAFLCAHFAKDAMHKENLSILGFDMVSRVQRISRFSTNYSKSFEILTDTNTAEIFDIKVDGLTYLVGLSTCSGPSGSSHDINVTITDETNNKELAKETCKVKSDGTGKYHTVYVARTKLEPNITYRVTVLMVGTEQVGYSTGERNRLTVGNHGVRCETIQRPHEGPSYYSPQSYTPELLLINRFNPI